MILPNLYSNIIFLSQISFLLKKLFEYIESLIITIQYIIFMKLFGYEIYIMLSE